MKIVNPPLTLTPLSVPDGVRGESYNQTIQAKGGQPPYEFQLKSGVYPDGISNVSTENDKVILSGVPTKAGNYPFVLAVWDSAGVEIQQEY